jgi:ribosomal protein S18 acetylase RimI-like enzyme
LLPDKLDYLWMDKTIDIEGIIEFSQRCPWKPGYSAGEVRRFLTELVSSESLVFESGCGPRRICAAVLLDKVSNPARDASLEILGMLPHADFAAAMKQVLEFAKTRLPPQFAGFQVALHESLALADLMKAKGLRHFYDIYEMAKSDLTDIREQTRAEIVGAVSNDGPEVYEVLCESFKNNPEISVPDKGVWISGFLRSNKSHVYLWKESGKIAGFATLLGTSDVEAEVRTIGVLPEFRGKSLGRYLLQHCLSEAAKLGFRACRLTVAVQNAKALGLYLNQDFKPVEKFSCYRFVRQKEERR